LTWVLGRKSRQIDGHEWEKQSFCGWVRVVISREQEGMPEGLKPSAFAD
jgi:hypothetical protein